MPRQLPARPDRTYPTTDWPVSEAERQLVGFPGSDPPYTQFGRSVTGEIYAAGLGGVLGPENVRALQEQAREAIRAMSPRDPAEEMLIQQLVLAHSRVQRLTAILTQQTKIEAIRTLSEYVEQASNTYRRLLLALAEYRRPPRTGDTFAVVKQANFAHQQVIQNQDFRNDNATNEQGCESRPKANADAANSPAARVARGAHANKSTGPGGSAALPAECQGPRLPAFERPQGEAVGKVNRATHGGG